MANDLKKGKVEEIVEQEPEKIKLGETEFTSQELEDLVGAGRRLKEIEEKQGQPVDKILESWGRRGEVLGKFKKLTGVETPEELEARKKEEEKPQEVLDEEALKNQIIAEAKKYGLLTREEAQSLIKEVYENNRAGERLLAKTNKVLNMAKKEGKPVVETEKLLEFMADPANPKDPEKAYKLMFEKELDEWKEEKLMSIKKPGFVTQEGSTAGAKTPVSKVPRTRDELTQALMEHMNASE